MKTRLTLFFAIPAASLLLLSMLLHAQPKTDPEQHPGRYQLTSGTYGTASPPPRPTNFGRPRGDLGGIAQLLLIRPRVLDKVVPVIVYAAVLGAPFL
jgi:hypothetical protein